MSKAVIRSNLDNDTLSQVLEKGEFDDYSERFQEDGLHDFPNEEESVDFDVEIQHSNESVSDEDDIARDNGEEVAYKSKIEKRIKNNDENGEKNEEEISRDDVKKFKQLKKKKKGFTVQDMIARNFQELLCEKKEYTLDENGKRTKTKKTWFKILSNATSFGFSLTNTLVGAGILSLSQTCYKMGLFGFTAWCIATIVYFVITWNYFNRAIYLTGAATMGELLSLIFGKVFAAIVDICNTAFYFCVLMCYQVIATQYIMGIVSDLMGIEKATENFTTLDLCYEGKVAGIFCKWHYILLYLVSLCLNFPLIIPKSVKFLNRISTLTVISAIIASFCVMIKAIVAGAKGESSNGGVGNVPTFSGKWWPSGALDFFTMAPFITANFQIHSSLPPLFVGTKGLSKKVKLAALQGGSYVSCVICTLLFMIMAISGHISFDKVSSNVLNDFSREDGTIDYVIVICRILMTIVVVISYPALMFPTSAGIMRYIPKTWKLVQFHNGRFMILIIRTVILLASTFVSTFITDIGVIFSVASAIFSIFVVYVCPLSIMMLWPRVEKLGDPKYRKLSVIDNLIYNKVATGNQVFTQQDIETAVGRMENGDENAIDDVVLNIQTNEKGEEEIELKEEKKEESQDIHVEVSDKEVQNLNEFVDVTQFKNQFIKLPPAEIPWWRYTIFITCMVICVILCIVSVVGTLIGG